MFYLSQLILNPRSRQVQAELQDPYQMHRTVAKAFGHGDAWNQARCLFRVDERPMAQAPEIEAPHLLLQSHVLPHWEWLTASSDYLLGPPQLREFHPRFRAGQRLAFRLRANPTFKRNGKREGLYQAEERRNWLERKAGAGGFRVVFAMQRDVGQPTSKVVATRDGDTKDIHIPQLQFHVPLKEGNRIDSTRAPNLAAFSAAQFDGELIVTDPARFRATLEAGIGAAKSFGFGLLSLAKA